VAAVSRVPPRHWRVRRLWEDVLAKLALLALIGRIAGVAVGWLP